MVKTPIYFIKLLTEKPVPVAARSKAYVCGLSPAEIVGSNPTGGMDVCLLWVLSVVRKRSLPRVDHSSRGVLPTVLLVVCYLETSWMRRPWPTGGLLGQKGELWERFLKQMWTPWTIHLMLYNCFLIYFLNKGKFLDVNASTRMIQHSHKFVHEFTKAKYSQTKCIYIHDLYCGKDFKTHWFLDFSIFQKSKQNTLWKTDLFVLRRLLNRWIAVFSSIQDDELCPEMKQTEV